MLFLGNGGHTVGEVKFEKGRSVRLFLIDGEPGGRYQVDMTSGITRAYKIPRSLIMESFDIIDELQYPAVYFLFCKNDTNETDAPYSIYIGETENPKERFSDHLRNKDWFEEAVILLTSNGFLNKAHVKYLESKFIEFTSNVGVYETRQKKASNLPRLSDADISDLQVVIKEAKILLPALGFNFLEKSTQKVLKEKAEKVGRQLFLTLPDVDAKILQTEQSIILLKGSKIKETPTSSCPKKTELLRKEYAKKINTDHVLLQDIEFTSLNQAASFASGRTINAPESLKTAEGISLKKHK